MRYSLLSLAFVSLMMCGCTNARVQAQSVQGTRLKVRMLPIYPDVHVCTTDISNIRQVTLQLPSVSQLLSGQTCNCVTADGVSNAIPLETNPLTPFDINLTDPDLWNWPKQTQIKLHVVLPPPIVGASPVSVTFLKDPQMTPDGSDTRFALAPYDDSSKAMFACRSAVLVPPMMPSTSADIVINKMTATAHLNIGVIVNVGGYYIPLVIDPMVPNKG